MGSIIIPASRSLTISNEHPHESINKDTISVGNKDRYSYSSFLFFDISQLPLDVCIEKAELILFKTDNFYDDKRKCFCIHPLSELFSTFTTYKNAPEVDRHIKEYFYPITSKVSVSADITEIFLLWVENKMPNNGIVLSSKENIIARFGSSISQDQYLVPFIRVDFTTCHKKNYIEKFDHPKTGTCKEINVIGTVAADSVYEIIVELEVTRIKNCDKDKYYVSDTYDNTGNSKPLRIDKTYKLAVIPHEKHGDTEVVNLYGSYKVDTKLGT